MDFENEEHDNLKFQYLAGGNILEYPPLYAPSGDHLLFMTKNEVNVYSTISGQFVRKLEGSEANLIDFQFELKDDNRLLACNELGDILSWDWKTGDLKDITRIPFTSDKQFKATNFKLLNLYGKSELAHAFVCFKPTGKALVWRVFDRGEKMFVRVPCDLKLIRKPLVVVDTKNFPNLILTQQQYIYFVNYNTWTWLRLFNSNSVPITALQIHPTEECVATGDEVGKIFLWREFKTNKTVTTVQYHWHHTKVTSICFTQTGSNFYSSGEESVMVKWLVEDHLKRIYTPRMAASIRHIVVSPDNTRVAVCTVDNSIQLFGTEKTIYQNLQEFTYIQDDKTENSKFPTGLRLNPRNNSLVLNGRIGSLQFYNTHTKSLLYNVNIINQNLVSKERDRILYNIEVTKAAFNIDWMATGEVFNDEEHFPELRLKFWRFDEKSQNYALNTNIELPHEGGFKAIEFSNEYQVENLLCATVGEDNIIKMWSLEDSDDIYKKGKTWYCIAQTSYKNLPIESISFSQDGSLLAAGYGNTLCIYKSDNLKLKAALTGSNGLDGCVNKAQIKVPIKNINGAKSELQEKRKKIMQLFTNLLETNEETLVKELQTILNNKKSSSKDSQEPLTQLDDQQKTNLYRKIIQMHELNLHQKVLLYQKLGIACKTYAQMETKMAEYFNNLANKKIKPTTLRTQTHRLNLRQRFKAKYRLEKHHKQQTLYDEQINKNLVPIMSLLNLNINTTNKPVNNQNTKNKIKANKIAPPKPTMAEITHVQFAAGEYAHLVVVCTEKRILIWNLLTLRLQSVLKLSVKHLTFDPQTNLVAVVTQNNELHLFQPNVPLPIYQRRNLPNLFGIAWMPRRYPKQRSINLDWQAQSTLYFLNENQEIVYLTSPSDKQSDVPAAVVFDNAAKESIQYTTFGTYAIKAVNDKHQATRQKGPLILGNSDKTAIKALIDMSVHTMPPMSLICEDFLKSMVKAADTKPLEDTNNTNDDALTSRLNGDLNGFGNHSHDEDDDDDDEDGDVKMANGSSPSSESYNKLRKDLLNKTEELKRKQKSLGISENNPSVAPANEDEEQKLRSMAKQVIQLDF